MYRVIRATMAPEEVEKAILENRPFDLDSYRKYRGSDIRPDVVKAKDLTIGGIYINTEDASEFDLNHKFKVLQKKYKKGDMLGDYTFHIQDLTDGSVFDIHYDADDYVGVRA